MAADTQPQSFTEQERDLREQLRGVRLVSEIGLPKSRLRQLSILLQMHGRHRVDYASELVTRFPATLVTYLVGVGVHEATGGRLWPDTVEPIRASENPGACFVRALKRLGLHDFGDLVEEDNAHPYVGRILAHAGLPRTCASGFLVFLERELRRGGVRSADDLLAGWRTERARLTHLHKPAQRFLLYGGAPAVDLLDRCVDLIAETARTGRVPAASASGLPEYLVDAYKESLPDAPPTLFTATGVRRPRIEVDPFDGLGPVAVLPPVPPEMAGGSWRVHTGASTHDVSASSLAESRVRLDPAPSWTIAYQPPSGSAREWAYEAFERFPALFIDPADGRVLRDPAALALSEAWILRPAAWSVTTVGGGRSGALSGLPRLIGAWAGYELEHVELENVQQVVLKTPADPGRQPTINVRRVAERPQLIGDLVEGVTTTAGHPVYRSMPSVAIPAADAPPDRWRFELRAHDRQPNRFIDPDAVEEGTVELDRRVRDDEFGTYKLVVRGPLGSDLSAGFAVVPGLTVERPSTVVMPGADSGHVRLHVPAPLHIESGSPGEDGTAVCAPDSDFVEARIKGPSREAVVQVAVPTLLWNIAHETKPASALSAVVVRIGAEEFDDELADVLTVKLGKPGIEMAVSLRQRGRGILMEQEPVLSGGRDGRWSFDLGPFSDTIRRTEEAGLQLWLRVGIHDVQLAEIVPPIVVRGLRLLSARLEADYTAAHFAFEQERFLTDRVLRLWSLDRPWTSPVVEPIPDGEVEAVVSGYGRLPAGKYVVQVDLDDPWLRPRFPGTRAAGTAVLRIGDGDDVKHRREGLDLQEPLEALEALLVGAWHGDGAVEAFDLASVAREAAVGMVFLLPETLTERPPRPLVRIAELLAMNPSALLGGLADLAASGDVESRELLRLQLLLLPIVRDMDVPAAGVPFETAWKAAPILAAALDRHEDEAARARRARFVHPALGSEDGEIPTGGSVTQREAGMRSVELLQTRHFLALVPQSALDDASLQLASFEWLAAEIEAEEAGRRDRPSDWLRSFEHLSAELPRGASPELHAHIEARAARPGTIWWAELPRVVLAAAAHLVCGEGNVAGASMALASATAFAPRLVEHDVLLALTLDHGER